MEQQLASKQSTETVEKFFSAAFHGAELLSKLLPLPPNGCIEAIIFNSSIIINSSEWSALSNHEELYIEFRDLLLTYVREKFESGTEIPSDETIITDETTNEELISFIDSRIDYYSLVNSNFSSFANKMQIQ
jgi:hypothetical protein